MLLEMIYHQNESVKSKHDAKRVLTVDDNSKFGEWQVPREQEQDLDEGPSSWPDERNLSRKRQKIIENLEMMNHDGRIRHTN
jgi:hypothetical protein